MSKTANWKLKVLFVFSFLEALAMEFMDTYIMHGMSSHDVHDESKFVGLVPEGITLSIVDSCNAKVFKFRHYFGNWKSS